jgi:hypothetical protein
MARWTALLIAALAALLFPGPALASCMPTSAADQELAADLVVDGTVSGMTTVGINTEVTIAVDRILKGSSGDTVVVLTSLPGEGVVGDVPFYEGWKFWRLYLEETEPGSGRFTTSTCAGTRPRPAPSGI